MLDASQVEAFAARLNASPGGIEEAWKSKWSREIAEEMKSLVPVRTGALRSSIRATSQGVEVGVRYGAFVEYGTADTRPQPFTLPAINRLSRPAAEDAGRRVVEDL